jgi:hypothetical protein
MRSILLLAVVLVAAGCTGRPLSLTGDAGAAQDAGSDLALRPGDMARGSGGGGGGGGSGGGGGGGGDGTSSRDLARPVDLSRGPDLAQPGSGFCSFIPCGDDGICQRFSCGSCGSNGTCEP